jgi:hypothetical protein
MALAGLGVRTQVAPMKALELRPPGATSSTSYRGPA